MKPFEMIEGELPSNSGYLAFTLRGYLDAHTVNEFEAFMDRSIETGGLRYVLDISELNYISSAGIGAIMAVTQRLRRSEGELVLLRPNEKVFNIFDKLGFTKIFRVAYSREEAEKFLAA